MSEFVERVLESKGKSIDEAIFRGLQELGVSIDEVRIDTIQEGSKGLLGLGAKPFIVRLTTRPIDLSAMEPEKKPKRERSPRPVRTERGSEAAAQESVRQEKNGQEESRAKDRPPRSRGGRSRNERAGRGEQQGRGSRERSAALYLRIPRPTPPMWRARRSARARISSRVCSSAWAWTAASVFPIPKRRSSCVSTATPWVFSSAIGARPWTPCSI